MFVTGLERGLVPISHAKTSEAMDEEQRLLYVALEPGRARAAPELGATAHRRRPCRQPHPEQLARAGRAAPSPAPTPTRPTVDVDVRERIADARAHVSEAEERASAEVAEADAPLFAALVEWRLKLSRALERARLRHLPQHHARRDRRRPPASTGRSSTVPGVGPVKAERYGEAVLALVAEHATPGPPPLPIDVAPLGVHDGRSGPQRRCESGGGRNRKEPGDAHRRCRSFPPTTAGRTPRWRACEPVADDDIDLDLLELRCDPHAYSDLTELERYVVAHRYGLDCPGTR